MRVRYPTFLGIGTQKAATTWLARMVQQHPEVYVPEKKEVHYFNLVHHYQKGVDWYLDHFADGQAAPAIGEFTPNYFWTTPYKASDREGLQVQNEVIPQLVHALLPDVKLIVCLRDPVERAISSYFHQIRSGNIKPSESILDVAHFHGIDSMGFYDVHFQNWLQYYPLDRFLILFYEDDIRDDVQKKRALQRVFRHIGVDETFEPSAFAQKYNRRHMDFDMRVNHLPLPLAARRMIKRYTPNIIKGHTYWRIEVTPEEREALRDRYHTHNKNLEKILGRQLPWFRN